MSVAIRKLSRARVRAARVAARVVPRPAVPRRARDSAAADRRSTRSQGQVRLPHQVRAQQLGARA